MPASSAAIVASLQDAQTTRKAIRIVREHEWCADDLRGFVVGVSGGWAVLQALADAVYCDGYEILRVQDVTEVCDDSKEGYVERAVAVLGRPVVDFRLPAEATTSEVLRAASDHAELISVHTEEVDSDALAIGHLYDLGDRDFDLQLIDREGQWRTCPLAVRRGDPRDDRRSLRERPGTVRRPSTDRLPRPGRGRALGLHLRDGAVTHPGP